MVCQGLTVARVAEIADGAPVRLADDTLVRLARAFQDALAVGRLQPVYGRTTGVGANRTEQISEADRDQGMRLLRSHAVDTGELLPASTVRGMLAVRLNQLCLSGSGIDPAVVSGLERMLNTDALPEVRASGSIGTADLPALASAALVLVGERPASRPFEPIEAFGPESALPFMSSSALTIARGMLAVAEAARLDRAGRVVTAISALALDANRQAFSHSAAQAAAAPGVEEVAAQLRALLGDGGPTPRIQDPYGFRVAIHTQGAVVHAVDALVTRLEVAANTVQENPFFVADGQVIHHGGFYQIALGLALDATNLALAQAGPMILARMRMLFEPAFTGLAPFLAVGPPGSSGLMMIEYTAAAALADLRAAAFPASLGSVVLSRGNEDGASFASQSAIQLERAVTAYRSMIGVELLAATRAVAQRGLAAGTDLLAAALELTIDLTDLGYDRDLRPYLELADSLIEPLATLLHAG